MFPDNVHVLMLFQSFAVIYRLRRGGVADFSSRLCNYRCYLYYMASGDLFAVTEWWITYLWSKPVIEDTNSVFTSVTSGHGQLASVCTDPQTTLKPCYRCLPLVIIRRRFIIRCFHLVIIIVNFQEWEHACMYASLLIQHQVLVLPATSGRK